MMEVWFAFLTSRMLFGVFLMVCDLIGCSRVKERPTGRNVTSFGTSAQLSLIAPGSIEDRAALKSKRLRAVSACRVGLYGFNEPRAKPVKITRSEERAHASFIRAIQASNARQQSGAAK